MSRDGRHAGRPTNRSPTSWRYLVRTPLSRLAVLGAFVFAACSGGPTPPDVPEVPEVPGGPNVPGGQNVSLDEVLTQLNTVGTYATAGLAPLGVSGAFGAPAASTANCPYNAGTKYFVCPSQSASGLTVDASYQLLDGNGNPMPIFNSTTVAGIRYVVDVNGAIDAGEGTTIGIASHDEQVVTGLQTATRTVNGSGSTDLSMVIDGQTLSITSTRSTSNLVLPSEPGPGKYPASGSISFTATADQVTYSATMTFNGTSTVSIVSTLDGTTQTCTYNLATPETPAVCS